MHRGRPHPRARRSSLPVALVLALVLAGTAGASGGYRDRTPLPASVTHPAAAGTAHAGVSGGAIFRTLLGLLLVLGVIYGLYWVLKRYAATKGGARSDGQMDIVATTALGPAQALHLVRVGDELVLVGRAEQSVTGIRVYEADEAGRLLQLLSGGEQQFHEPSRGGGVWTVAVDELRRRTARG